VSILKAPDTENCWLSYNDIKGNNLFMGSISTLYLFDMYCYVGLSLSSSFGRWRTFVLLTWYFHLWEAGTCQCNLLKSQYFNRFVCMNTSFIWLERFAIISSICAKRLMSLMLWSEDDELKSRDDQFPQSRKESVLNCLLIERQSLCTKMEPKLSG